MTMSASIPADDTGQYPALAGYAPASTGERIGGYLLDAVIGAVISVISLVPMFAALASVGDSSNSDAVGGALGIGMAGVIAVNVIFLVLVLYVLFAKGARVGSILLGLQNVDVQTGRVSGGKTFLKYLLQSLIIAVTLGLGMILLVATIRPGLGRNWFDRTTGVVVINNRRGRKPGAPAPDQPAIGADRVLPPAIQQVGFPGAAANFAPAGPGMAGGPGGPGMAGGSGGPGMAGPSAAGPGGMPFPSAAPPAPVSPLDSWQPVAGAAPSNSSPSNSPFGPPSNSPFAPVNDPFAPASSNDPFAPAPSNDPFAPPPAGPSFAPSNDPFAPPPAGPSFAPPPAGAGFPRAGFPSAPATPAYDPAPVAGQAMPSFPSPPTYGEPAPTPAPLVREMRPPQGPTVDPTASGANELDRTMARSFTTARIRIDNGEVLDIDTPVLLGRNPGQLPGFESARLVPVADLARSISKTHLAVGPDGSGVWVEDLNSMNGVRVTAPGGAPTKAVVGQRYPVPPGGRVEFGDRSFVVVAG